MGDVSSIYRQGVPPVATEAERDRRLRRKLRQLMEELGVQPVLTALSGSAPPDSPLTVLQETATRVAKTFEKSSSL